MSRCDRNGCDEPATHTVEFGRYKDGYLCCGVHAFWYRRLVPEFGSPWCVVGRIR